MAERHASGRGLDPPGRSTGPGFTPRERSAEHGFTLIEIMVALAVFSLAALALIRLEGATIRSTGALDSILLAQTVARNVAIGAITDARPPTAGRTEGNERNGGRDWHWTREARAIGDGQVMRVDVTVAGQDGRELARMTMVRPQAEQAQ